MLKCPCKTCKGGRLTHNLCKSKCERFNAYRQECIEIKKDLKNAAEIAKYANRYSG